MDYRYQEDNALPTGWELAIYEDGKVIICSPGKCPEELGGYDSAEDYDTAMQSIIALLEDVTYGG
jgi:hypothetical protein